MNNLPEEIKKYGLHIFNFSKAIGPFILSQSEKASEAFAKHNARLASVEIMKEVIINEAKVLQSIKEELLKRRINADDLERIRIKRDLREIDESLRTLNIGQKALSYLPKPSEGQNIPTNNSSKSEISDSWLDRFNELAKLSNESWREDLLARALAKEANSPGRVSPRALWLIGTLEEKLFHAFATLFDISVSINEEVLIIPEAESPLLELIVPDCDRIFGKNLNIGELVFLLGDTGLIANILSVEPIHKGEKIIVQYDTEKFEILCRVESPEQYLDGVLYTGLGNTIAAFYKARPNKLGKDNFHSWLNSLKKNPFEISKIG